MFIFLCITHQIIKLLLCLSNLSWGCTFDNVFSVVAVEIYYKCNCLYLYYSHTSPMPYSADYALRNIHQPRKDNSKKNMRLIKFLRMCFYKKWTIKKIIIKYLNTIIPGFSVESHNCDGWHINTSSILAGTFNHNLYHFEPLDQRTAKLT